MQWRRIESTMQLLERRDPDSFAESRAAAGPRRCLSEQETEGKRQQNQEPKAQPHKVEPATGIFFLCSYDNRGKTFVDAAALRKDAHVHGERGSMFLSSLAIGRCC